MKLKIIAKITLYASIAVNIANLFTKINLAYAALFLLICSLYCYWADEINARWDAVFNEHKAIINRIIAESVVCEIETEIEGPKELWTRQELLEMIEEKKKNYEDFK